MKKLIIIPNMIILLTANKSVRNGIKKSDVDITCAAWNTHLVNTSNYKNSKTCYLPQKAAKTFFFSSFNLPKFSMTNLFSSTGLLEIASNSERS